MILRFAFLLREKLAQLLDVALLPNETQRDVIDPEFSAERDIGDVFLGQGRQIHPHARAD